MKLESCPRLTYFNLHIRHVSAGHPLQRTNIHISIHAVFPLPFFPCDSRTLHVTWKLQLNYQQCTANSLERGSKVFTGTPARHSDGPGVQQSRLSFDWLQTCIRYCLVPLNSHFSVTHRDEEHILVLCVRSYAVMSLPLTTARQGICERPGETIQDLSLIGSGESSLWVTRHLTTILFFRNLAGSASRYL